LIVENGRDRIVSFPQQIETKEKFMTTMEQVRPRHITLMQNTMATIAHTIQRVSQADATTHRDGADGWTVLGVVRILLQAQ
jgi:hypothetical protein